MVRSDVVARIFAEAARAALSELSFMREDPGVLHLRARVTSEVSRLTRATNHQTPSDREVAKCLWLVSLLLAHSALVATTPGPDLSRAAAQLAKEFGGQP